MTNDHSNDFSLVRFVDKMEDRLRWAAGQCMALTNMDQKVSSFDQCDLDAISNVEEQLRKARKLLGRLDEWRTANNELPSVETVLNELRETLNILRGMDESAHAAPSKGADCQMMLEVIRRETQHAIERVAGIIKQ